MTFYAGLPFQGSGTPISLDGNDQYLLAPGVTVYSTNYIGIIADNGGNTLTIEGTLIGGNAAQLGTSATNDDIGNRLIVMSSGVVIG